MSRNRAGRVSRVSVPVPKRSATIHLVQSSRLASRLARLLVVFLVAAIISMVFLPWQQTSRGSGRVVAYVPQERQQSVDSPVKGIVYAVAEDLVEGSEVKKDQFVVEIQPFSPNLIAQLNMQKKELEEKLRTNTAMAQAYAQNVQTFTEALEFTVQSANEMLESTREKLESKKQKQVGNEAKEFQANLNYERQRKLFVDGIKPEKEIEKLKKELDVAKADVQSTQRDIAALEKEVSAKLAGVEEKRRLAQTKIDYARAMEQDALGKATTIRKELLDIDIKLDASKRTTVTAPRDGILYRLPVYERGQAIKEGQALFTIVPKASQKAVELMIAGNDVPLVRIGDEVRLQFEGWPAVQIAGWPSIAVGVFSGRIASIDPTDNGKGMFRVMVVEGGDLPEWPTDRFLRQGVRANGWVMLRKVTLGWEIWRQLNGFPIIPSDMPGKKAPKSKPPISK